jgi:thiol-disulfide isomerase/thioredoxin
MMMLAGSLFSCTAPPSESRSKETRPKSVINDLPSMTINLLDGTKRNIKELKGKTILIFFQPDCDHCQREAEEIQNNLAAFKNSNLYFITSYSLQEIEKFANDHRLLGYANIYFAGTSIESILNNFGPIKAPSIYIYSSEQKLIKTFNGEVRIETVLEYI